MSMSVEVGPGEVFRARRAIRRALDGADESVVSTAELLASELATNALVHTGGPAVVRIDVGQRTVRVEVSDPSAIKGGLEPLEVDESSEHGRGLAIVASLAASWGVAAGPGPVAKTVWFELDL